jgi:hypothetical protein
LKLLFLRIIIGSGKMILEKEDDSGTIVKRHAFISTAVTRLINQGACICDASQVINCRRALGPVTGASQPRGTRAMPHGAYPTTRAPHYCRHIKQPMFLSASSDPLSDYCEPRHILIMHTSIHSFFDAITVLNTFHRACTIIKAYDMKPKQLQRSC